MSVLSKDTIIDLCKNRDLIRNWDQSCVEGASYDMRLGADIYRNGQHSTLNSENASIKIEPGEFVTLSSLEHLKIPNDLVGHNGLSSTWTRRGVVSLFSPQIDPGFEGMLVVPVFNAGDSAVTIRLHEKIFTIEFTFTDKPAPYLWSERHGPQKNITSIPTPERIRPNFVDLHDIEKKQQDIQRSLDILNSRVDSLKASVDRLDGFNSGFASKLSFRNLSIALLSIILT